MNPRERALAIILVSIVLFVGGGLGGYRFVYVPWDEKKKALTRLGEETRKKELRQAEIEADLHRLALWRQISLPADPDVARREYAKYLTDLLNRSGFAPGKVTLTSRPIDPKSGPTLPGKKDVIYTKVVFNIQAEGSMASLVQMMKEFYRTPVLHQIKGFTLQRQLTGTTQSRTEDLRITQMTVEALIVAGADNRTYLLPNIDRRLLAADAATAMWGAPSGLGLALWAAGPAAPATLSPTPRIHEAVARKNIFLGRPPAAPRESTVEREPLGTPEWMAPRWVYLTDIAPNKYNRTVARLYDRSTNRHHKDLRAAAGYDSFPFIKDGDGRPVVRATVVRVEDRELIYRVELYAEESRSTQTGFARLDKKDRDTLLADKLIANGEEDRVYRVGWDYWESLERQRVVQVSDGKTFRFELDAASDRPGEDFDSRIRLLSGEIIRKSDTDLYIRIEEKYCVLHVGQNVEDSLYNALKKEKIKELKTSLNK